jgi:hypothetical protein
MATGDAGRKRTARIGCPTWMQCDPTHGVFPKSEEDIDREGVVETLFFEECRRD